MVYLLIKLWNENSMLDNQYILGEISSDFWQQKYYIKIQIFIPKFL